MDVFYTWQKKWYRQANVDPETRKLKAIEITDVTEGARLMAFDLIGYLSLTSAITLNIIPKFPIQNLWTMLELGGDPCTGIIPTLRHVETVSSVFKFGIDSQINRIVKAACLRFSAIMPRTDDWNKDRRFIGFVLDALQRVPAQKPGIHDFNLDEMVSLRLRAHYSGLLRVYRRLLTGWGIAFTFEPGGRASGEKNHRF